MIGVIRTGSGCYPLQFSKERTRHMPGLERVTSESTNVPRVSIGMPVYNGAKYLELALDSILSQTFTDFELIISDNASSDGTQEICERYRDRDPRIRYFRNERNMGASWNFNRVYALSRAPYFKQAAHDDLCAPTFLERCVEVLDRDPSAVMVYPRTILIDGEGCEIQRFEGTLDLRQDRPHRRFQRFHHVFGDWSICHPIFGVMRVAPVANREILPAYIASDMVLLCELALHGKIYELPEYLFSLRWHAGASTVANKPYEQRALWFDPTLANSISIPLTYYRWLYEYTRMIDRVQMTPFERFRCYQQMPRWIYRHRTKLARSAWEASAVALRRILHERTVTKMGRA
jgi:glycosyltransferase involved in cell wall biosynthesis